MRDTCPPPQRAPEDTDETLETSWAEHALGGSIQALRENTRESVGLHVDVTTDGCLVGRGAHCMLTLSDPHVSTSHCELVATTRGVRLTDLGSRNGTEVNGIRLERGSSVYLTKETVFRCGTTSIVFHPAGRTPVAVSAEIQFGPILGRSLAMRRLYARLGKIAACDLSVLITGETGTGKELVARAIHETSRRASGPLVTVDCTTIPASLAESKLFGHEKGAFTGAVARHVSPFVTAERGTVFFDELGEMPLEIQPKLLRALEARTIQSVGSNRSQAIDVRVVAATRRHMHEEMNAKRFRDDLYYRLAQIVVEVPPLRERPEDIPVLVASFLDTVDDPSALERIQPSMDRLSRHNWPGNVRELRNVVLAAHAQSDGGLIDVSPYLGRHSLAGSLPDREAWEQRPFHALKREILDELERDYFAKLVSQADGNISEISRLSGVSRPMVREYLQRHGLRATE